MLGLEHAHVPPKHLALHPFSIGMFALVREERSKMVRTRQRARMFGPEHTLLPSKQLALHRFSIVPALV